MRSALVPAACPFDFPDVNDLGEKLVHVIGPPWSASYAVPVIRDPRCWMCGGPIPMGPSGTGRAVSMNPVSGRMAWACETCATKAGARPDELKVSAMATANRESHLPPCVCGDAYVDHYRPITSIFDAYGEDGHGYRPATPFLERGWPHRLVVGYDHDRQVVLYADESATEAAA